MTEQLFQIGIKAFITNQDGNVLLLLADTSNHKTNTEPYWDIPGGRVQEGAGFEDTLSREVFEETGISTIVDTEFLTAVLSKHRIPLDDGTMSGLALLVYRVRIPVGASITLSSEHTSYEWVEPIVAAQRLSGKYPTSFTQFISALTSEGVH